MKPGQGADLLRDAGGKPDADLRIGDVERLDINSNPFRHMGQRRFLQGGSRAADLGLDFHLPVVFADNGHVSVRLAVPIAVAVQVQP